MLILLLVYLASQSWAKDVPHDSNYTIKYISSCPDTGYFFKKEPAVNKLVGSCYLCFCQGGDTAVCWPRENRKCDIQHYKHNSSVAKKETRVRRSPLGFGDIFFKDAARDVFNKKEPEVCKPYESSFSEGCPPVDWCTGCTVCDCDANGHWDCHILSFCDDEKGKGKNQQKKVNNKALSFPKPRNSSAKMKTTQKTSKTRRPPLRTVHTTKKPPVKKIHQKQKGPSKTMKPRSFIQKGKSVKPLIIKKKEKNPKFVKTSPSKKVVNVSDSALNKELMKSMVSAMQKLWTKQVTAALPGIVNMIQKRSSNNRAKGKTPVNKNKNKKYKKPVPPTKNGRGQFFNKSLFIRKQRREDQKKEMQRKREIQKKQANAPKVNNNNKKRHVTKPMNKNAPVTRSNNKLNNNKKPNNKPSKTTNKPNKPSNKPNNKPKNKSNNKRTKRELNNDQTSSLYFNKLSEIPVNPIENFTLEHDTTMEPPTTASLGNDHVVVTGDTLYTNTKYYEYSMQVTTENPEVKTNTSYNNIIKDTNESNNGNKIGKDITNLAYEIPKEVANDIKLTKWSEIKMLQVKEEKTNLNLNKTTPTENIFDNEINETKPTAVTVHNEYLRKKVNRKDIERIIGTTKKYSLLRMVNTNNCKSKRGNDVKLENNYRHSLSSKIDNLRNVLKRLLGEFRKNDTSSLENKRKKTNAIKYLKKFFNKIFFKDSNKTIISQRLRNNNHTIQMLCESFGPCIINRKNKMILMKKIRELNNETIQILKSLRIIKGLLRLVDIPQDLSGNSLNDTSNFKTDVHKLNIILKRSFQDSEKSQKITETQCNQITYIKKNTKMFTQSVAKFTKILNEIIDLISVKSEKERKWYSESKSKESRNSPTKVNLKQKFKQLLNNYNIVHNTFISKLIEVFTSMQSDDTDVGNHDNTVNNTGTEYSKNILKNLNKLKNLASVLNPMRRQKRHAVRQDNAVEYLLMLMEYMFQQNQLDSSPVNDGIDLLIEAIKNAPDIKTVKKKVLKNNPLTTQHKYRAAGSVINKNTSDENSASDNEISMDDSNLNRISNEDSVVNKISNEDSNMNKISNEDSILNTSDNSSSINQGESNDDENESDLQLLKLVNHNTGLAKELVFKNSTTADKSLKSKEKTKQSADRQNTNNNQSSTDITGKVYMGEDDVLADFDSRLEKSSGEIIKKSELFNSDLEEDNNVEYQQSTSKALTVKEEPTTYLPIVKTETAKPKTNLYIEEVTVRTKLTTKKEKLNDNNEQKSLEWTDEKDNSDSAPVNNTIEDIGIEIPQNINNKYIATTTGHPTTKEKPAQTFEIDLSDVSKEYSDEKSKGNKMKKAEDVLIKKEQDLLNSLDYGTEASIVEDSESKDGADEKFLSDYFAE